MKAVVTEWINQTSPLAWLAETSKAAAQQVNDQPWPTKKTEHWKFTSLKSIERGGYSFLPAKEQAASALALDDVTIPALDVINLVFVDGQYRADLSNFSEQKDVLPAGLTLVDFADANAEQQKFICENMHASVKEPKHYFAHLNAAMLSQGTLVQVAPNTQIKQPVQITHYSTQQAHEKGFQHRVLVDVGHHAELSLIELFISDESEHAGWMNQVTEIIQAAESHVHHYRLQKEQQAMTHIGSVHVSLEKQAHFNSFMLGFGGKLKRVDYIVHHKGEAAEVDLQGVYLVNQKQHFDVRTQVEHLVPRCLTNEVFRGVIDDQSSAVFNGKITIHKDAQKTLAEMSNHNFLLSDQAQINTKPELEIYADDVKCAHGATISQISGEALSYLRVRGISKAEAEVMLSFGFINEVLQTIKHPEVLDYLRPSIVRRFGQNDQLTRHLLS